MMSHDRLMQHYKSLRVLKKEGYSTGEVFDMLPYEKEAFIALILDERKREKQNQEK